VTEYLDEEQLSGFFEESKKVLKTNGKLITTLVCPYGLGVMYIVLAKFLRGISKYNYRKKQVVRELKNTGFKSIRIIDLNSWLHVPWAYLVIAQ
jgi:hypothetical protein